MKVANERLAEMIAGLSVEAGPKETLGDVTARRLSIASPDELGAILTELLSLRNAQSEAVAVKALKWEILKYGRGGFFAQSPFGEYRVWHKALVGGGRQWTLSLSMGEAVLHEEGLIVGGAKEAKAAAQADFDQRIRSALIHPAPPLAVTDEMVERAVDAYGPVGTMPQARKRRRTRRGPAMEAKQ